MTINPFPFKILFWFENDSKIITEIKRTDIQSEDKSLVYKWLIIENGTRSSSVATEPYGESSKNDYQGRISILTFQSMDSSGENQTRTFAEGILRWDAHEALFEGEKLTPVNEQQLENQWLEVIARFLR
jgi:hypothetical protein